MKRKISIMLAIMMTLLTILPIAVVNAETIEKIPVSMKIKNADGKTLTSGTTYTDIMPGDEITVEATCMDARSLQWSKNAEHCAIRGLKVNDKGMAILAYLWDNEGTSKARISEDPTEMTITVPENFKAGSTHTLYVQAVGAGDHYTPNGEGITYISTTGWVKIKFTIPSDEKITADVNVKYNNKIISPSKEITVKSGEKIVIEAVTNGTIDLLGYKWNTDSAKAGSDSFYVTAVPDSKAGTVHRLQVQLITKEGVRSAVKEYFFKIADDTEPDKTNITVNVEYDRKTISTGKTIEVDFNDELRIVAESDNRVSRILYYWDDESTTRVNKSSVIIEIPEDFEEGSKHYLYVKAIDEDGTETEEKKYTIRIAENNYDDDDDELIIEPWMKEEKDLSSLSVSLRTDSEEDKANKNIYELNEEVTYYVDYKNGGRDIKKKVTLVLNVPETFKVVSSDGGTVSVSKGTITWTFSSGLKEDDAGTKTVVLKYTKIGNKNVTYKIIKPLAEIKVDNKAKDKSAVMNLIYKDADVEIKNYHEPYMFGDKNATTFRPNDGITRAEAALVLTRTLGLSTSYDRNTYDYPDLDETYLEARKAIVAATAYGLVQGYPDGYYRPNELITRAEFMTIIANRVAEDNDDGFEIKDSSNSIKRYKDTTKVYVVNGSYENEHWALDEVTLLARLNMTPLNEGSKNLRLDETITRAEVAQLMNYFLLRAPADTTSKTRSGFSDVNKNHKLFADIIEATRDEHVYYITSDTKELVD